MDKNDLVERLEKAEAGSRELDAAVAVALYPGSYRAVFPEDFGGQGEDELFHGQVFDLQERWHKSAPPVTTSLDAALALAERVLPGWNWTMAAPSRSRKVRDRFFARVETPDFDCVTWEAGDKCTTDVLAGRDAAAYAASPALALCIAILRASNPMNEGGGPG